MAGRIRTGGTMSHLKYGADQIGSPLSRLNLMSVFSLAPLPVALWIAIYSVSTHAELYFNPRFLSDDPAAVADLSREGANKSLI